MTIYELKKSLNTPLGFSLPVGTCATMRQVAWPGEEPVVEVWTLEDKEHCGELCFVMPLERVKQYFMRREEV